jgi:hypothetical protein
VGDLVALVTDKVVPAGAMPDAGTLAENQEAFHDAFLGVSRSAHRADVPGHVKDSPTMDVATEGVFRFPTSESTSTYAVGDYIGAADHATPGAGLKSQTVVKVATPNLAVGRLFRIISDTEVWITIESVVLTGGVQAAA